MSVKRLTRSAVLTAVALTIFMIELQIPSLVPIPGVKLGLANIVTVYAIFVLGPADAAAILFARILLGSVFSGNMMALMYSIAGGVMCYLVMVLLRKLFTKKQIWICSVLGSIAHNIGQICVAVIVTSTKEIIYYLPVLLISGIIAGSFTGICAQTLIFKIGKLLPQYSIDKNESKPD